DGGAAHERGRARRAARDAGGSAGDGTGPGARLADGEREGLNPEGRGHRGGCGERDGAGAGAGAGTTAPAREAGACGAAGAAVKVTAVPLANAAAHVVPQEMPAGLLVTVPLPVPALETVNVRVDV